MIVDLILVGVGGILGSCGRLFINRWCNRRFSTGLPYGTLTVNLLGSFLLGWLIGANADQNGLFFGGIGVLGAFTTFSTVKLEMIRMLADKAWGALIGYIAATYILGIAAAFAGLMAAIK
jgi:CrcB protein